MCKHDWVFTHIGKLQFKTCKLCGVQYLRSDDSEEWVLMGGGEGEVRNL